MYFSRLDQERILARIKERTRGAKITCSVCGKQEWVISDALTPLSIQQEPGRFIVGGPYMPCVTLTCKNCGNTHLLNLVAIGLSDLLPKEKQADNEKEVTSEGGDDGD